MRFAILFATLFAFAAHALEVAEVEQYVDASSGPQLVWAQNFDNAELNRQIIFKSGRLAPSWGRNGTTGVIFERTDQNAYNDFVSFILPQTEVDKRYCLTFFARAEKIVTGQSTFPVACIEFTDELGRWTHGIYTPVDNLNEEWHEYKIETWMRKGDAVATLNLYLPKGTTGKIWYDDFTLTAAERNVDTLLLRPRHLTATPGKNDFRFRIPANAPADTVLLVIAENGGQTQKQLTQAGANGIAELAIDGLVEGPLTLTLKAAAPSQKRFIGTNRFNMSVRELDASVNQSGYDEDGIFRVNGTPMAPVGIFASAVQDYPKIAAAGYNFVMPYIGVYSRRDMVPPDQYSDDPAVVFRHFLDNADAVGLKVAFSLKDLLTNTFNPEKHNITDFKLGNDPMAVAAAIVNAIKDHPALLAWYINDESSLANLQNVIDMRELVSRLDPYHPTISLTYEMENLPGYANSGDIFSYDPYPIQADPNTKQSLQSAVPGIIAAQETMVPHWFTNQIFNWAIFNMTVDDPAFANTHTPTLEEMRALTLLAAIYGAKGFLGYSYESAVHRADLRIPGKGEENWKDVAALGAFLREFSPFFISTKPAPAVTVLSCSVKNEVRARAFVNAWGEVRVAIVGLGEPCTAIIQIEGAPKLQSVFGHTKALGDGKYEFTVNAINSDVLK